MKKMKFYVSYIGYARYGYDKPVGVKVYEADSTAEALAQILEHHGYGVDEDEDGNPEITSETELLKALESNNGDGCDHVISIISDNGALIFACEIYK